MTLLANAEKIQNDAYCKLYLPLQISATAETSRGKSETHTITNNGGIVISTVAGHKCAGFNGSSQYLSTPDSEDFNFGADDFTISFYVYFNSIASYQCLFNKWYQEGVAGNSFYFQWIETENAFRFGYSINGTDAVSFDTSKVISTGTWYFICIVRDAASLYVYIDGKKEQTHNIGSSVIYDTVRPFEIGYYSYLAFAPLNGYLSEFNLHKNIARHKRNFTNRITVI